MATPLQRTSKELTDIYQRHVEMVYRVSYMLLKNKADAQDATSAIFLKLIQKGPAFLDVEHEKAWLIVTTRNHCKNNLTYWYHKLKSPVEDLNTLTVQAHDDTQDLLELVLSLPEKYKLPLYLYYYEGYSTQEIATLLSLNESTLRSRLKIGREKLKPLIGGEDHEK